MRNTDPTWNRIEKKIGERTELLGFHCFRPEIKAVVFSIPISHNRTRNAICAEIESMVTSYYDAASGELIHQAGYKARDSGYKEALDSGFEDDIRPNLLILNGMLLRVGVRILVPRSPAIQKPEEHSFPDLAGTYSLQKMDQQLGSDEEEKLVQLLDRFAEYAISNRALALDSEAASYIRKNLGRVADYLGPKLRDGHLTVYKLRRGKSLEENGAFVFLDVSDPEKPVFLYPAFGLRAFTFANGFVPWRPGREETYSPDVEPNLRRRRPASATLSL